MDKGDLMSLLKQSAVLPGVNVPKPALPAEVEEKVTQLAESNLENKWDRIKEAMEGPFAERFLKEMDSLSGREFIRVYSKMLEYIKPKIVRVEGDKEEREENVIRIEIYNSKPTEPVIDITHEEDDESRDTETV
jgi:hypothetical protein